MRSALLAVLIFAASAVGVFGQALDADKLNRDIKAGDVLVDQWIGCSKAAATQLATKTTEASDIVAVAVFSGVLGSPREFFAAPFADPHDCPASR